MNFQRWILLTAARTLKGNGNYEDINSYHYTMAARMHAYSYIIDNRTEKPLQSLCSKS